MKKILAICLAAVMVLSLIACGGETSKKEENNEPAKEETAGLDKSCVGRFADSTTFDPDTEEDAMAGGELSDKGSLDDLDIDWSTVKAAIIVKTLSNESWTNIAGGIKDALEARGVKTVDLVTPDSESDAEQQSRHSVMHWLIKAMTLSSCRLRETRHLMHSAERHTMQVRL